MVKWRKGKSSNRLRFRGRPLEIEKQVIENCKTFPKDINDETIKEYIIILKYYDI